MSKEPISPEDERVIAPLLKKYSEMFGIRNDEISMSEFVRIRPTTSRPYGNMYVGN
ncbi:MAG: hypothetical protein Q4D38_04950 [Planctomycetia bacterium]|nr:hypothetical protein [Planctomycetia bacterium]